jgi:hypothetical protein
MDKGQGGSPVEILSVVLEALILGALVLLFLFLKFSIPSYASEKGKNLATKQDIGEITNEIEKARSEHTARLQELAHNLTHRWSVRQLLRFGRCGGAVSQSVRSPRR